MPWTQHVKSGRELVRRGFDVATRNGDVIYAAYGYANLIRNMLAAGDALAETQREADHGLEFARKVHFTFFIDLITAAAQAHSDSPRPDTDLRSISTIESSTSCSLSTSLSAGRCPGAAHGLLLDPEVAGAFHFWRLSRWPLDASSERARPPVVTLRTSETVEYRVLLLRSATRRSAVRHPTDQRQQHPLEAMTAHQEQLKVWANNCPENFRESRRTGRCGDCPPRRPGSLMQMRLYEQAIRSARDKRFVQNEALAYELGRALLRRRVALSRSRISICATPATGIFAGEPMARCGNSMQLHPHLQEKTERSFPARRPRSARRSSIWISRPLSRCRKPFWRDRSRKADRDAGAHRDRAGRSPAGLLLILLQGKRTADRSGSHNQRRSGDRCICVTMS